MRVAVLEQEIKDKDQLVARTKEVLEATQEQKVPRIFFYCTIITNIVIKVHYGLKYYIMCLAKYM